MPRLMGLSGLCFNLFLVPDLCQNDAETPARRAFNWCLNWYLKMLIGLFKRAYVIEY